MLSALFCRNFLHELSFAKPLQKEKKNLQDSNCVFVFNVADRDQIDRPTARLIKEFDAIEGMLQAILFYFICICWYIVNLVLERDYIYLNQFIFGSIFEI